MFSSEDLACIHEQVFQNRPETQSREKCESADNENGGNEQSTEQAACYWKSAGGFGNWLFAGKTSGDSHDRNDHEETAEELGDSCGRVVPQRIYAETCEG